MRSRSDTQEIGLDPGTRPVPIAATTAIFVLIVVAAVLFARQIDAIPPMTAGPTPTPDPAEVSNR